MEGSQFEWDPAKAAANFHKHKVQFREAATVFNDSNCIVHYDSVHSDKEDRAKAIGYSTRNRLLAVIYTVYDDATRIISAR